MVSLGFLVGTVNGWATNDGVMGGGLASQGSAHKGEPEDGHLSSLVETHHQPHRGGQASSLLYLLRCSGDVSTDSWDRVHKVLCLCF